MKDITELREEINQIDKDMALLFEKRMMVSKEIGEYKVLNNLPILDETREKELIRRNSLYIIDKNLLPYYEEFLTGVMNISKSIQKK